MRIKIALISILVTGIVIGGFSLFVMQNKNSETSNSLSVTPTNTVTINPKTTGVETPAIASGSYSVSWLIVRDANKISLHENFDEKLTTFDARVKYGCEHITSGGFYGEDNKPLGLLIVNGTTKSNSIKSELFNGFYSISKSGKATISSREPEESSTSIALQSGPILIKEGIPQRLTLETDENARRVVIAETTRNESVFLVVYMKSSPLVGPKLSELPKIVDDIQKNTSLKFTNALNLDGGTHSTFISGSLTLSEIARVGSFFCIKP